MEIIINQKQVDQLQEMLVRFPRTIPRILTRAINKIGVASRTQVLRKITQEYTITQRNLKKHKNVDLKKANFKTLTARLKIRGRRLSLLFFRARQTQKGVTYKIKKRRKKIYAFMESPVGSGKSTTMSSGHKGVFMRRKRGQTYAKRLPIIERFGPSVPHMFQGIGEFAEGVFERQIGKKLDREVSMQTTLVLRGMSRRGINII